MGLGLFYCQRVMQAHSGAITAQNLPGGGACFQLYFPERRATSVSQSIQVLLVEDDDDFAFLTGQLLREQSGLELIGRAASRREGGRTLLRSAPPAGSDGPDPLAGAHGRY